MKTYPRKEPRDVLTRVITCYLLSRGFFQTLEKCFPDFLCILPVHSDMPLTPSAREGAYTILMTSSKLVVEKLKTLKTSMAYVPESLGKRKG